MAHLAYWHGSAFSHLYPQLQPPLDLPQCLPNFMPSLAGLLEEVATMGVVGVAALPAATAKAIYSPRKTAASNWAIAWPCVWSPGLLAAESDLLFCLLHNVLPVRARIPRLDRTRSDGHCLTALANKRQLTIFLSLAQEWLTSGLEFTSISWPLSPRYSPIRSFYAWPSPPVAVTMM